MRIVAGFNLVLVLTLLAGGLVQAQTNMPTKVPGKPRARTTTKPINAKAAPAKAPAANLSETTKALIESKNNLIATTKEYKASLEHYLSFLEKDVARAQEKVETHRQLAAAGLLAQRDLKASEVALTEAQAKVAKQREELAAADSLMAEAEANIQLLLLPPDPVGTFRTTAALIRYNGGGRWVLDQTSDLSGFFAQRFGRSLPISAFGQTGTHERMGYDHNNRLDVAVHPDSAEGQALMTYLRERGIPFIAFRQAVAGSATGAHIHIGPPSHRIAR